MITALIAELDDARLVTLDMLAEAWPGEYEAKGETAHIDSSAPPAELPSPSLVDLSLGPAVDRALLLKQTEDTEHLLPGKAQAIVDILKAHNPFPILALRQISEDAVDLSKYYLSPEQIGTLLGDFPNIQFSNLLSRAPSSVRPNDAPNDAITHYEIDLVLGLKDWLLETEKQGHRPVPASAVEALEAVIGKLWETSEYKLMETKDAQVFCQTDEAYTMFQKRFRF
ncbi:hypothetical protein DXG03_000360 [Asterophora parasitica]|uniref:Uncharacterized protein n=1 Tax=Asterophora parasitica TaxID=117018 RepID=A0A9P7GFI0_9AGAR|nr:hypothetical protein DXG03_000360 [Asterophora parasitica]